MKKKTYELFSRTSFVGILPFVAIFLAIMVSCKSSHSVRDIKASRDPYYGAFIPQTIKVKVPTTTDDALTKGLFMLSRYSNIELPYIEGSETGSAVVSEQVTFTHAETIRPNLDAGRATNLSEVQHLNEVVVVAKSRFTPEQNGRVNIDFIVRVPKEMLSPNFRITLSPKVFHNDSIVPLDDVVLKGGAFAKKQKQDYIDYDNFLKSIVDASDYDSVFVDYDGVRKDITFQQEFYYRQYHKEWSRQSDFEEWRASKSDAEALMEARQLGFDRKSYHENIRKARQRAMQEVAKGRDTTGFFARYMNNAMKPKNVRQAQIKVEQRDDFRIDFFKEYSKRAKEQSLRDWAMGKDTVGSFARYMRGVDKNMSKLVLEGEDMSKIPEKFRDLYKTNRDMSQIGNQAFTEQDSVEIAQSRYKFEDIALNEMKKERREEKKREMIVFPYEEKTRLDTVIQTDRDFVFYYKQDYPVAAGLRRLRLTIDGTVDAVDKSRFVQPKADTLSYFISSLSQLADLSLIKETKTEHRDAYSTLVTYPKFHSKRSKEFSVNHADNKTQIDTVINSYRTFTSGKYVMDSVVLRVTTSLDGTYNENETASLNRANALKSYLASTLGVRNDIFKIRPASEDWNTLARLVTQRNDLTNKSEILDLLTNAVHPDQCEDEIKKKYPEDFNIIRREIYPKLNKAEIVFNMTRPDLTEEVVTRVETRPDYDRALKHLQDREYWEALEILSKYADFNTALCLVCMGYNQQAFNLLEKLKQTGNTEYLLAVLAIRSNDDSKAIAHLKKACELDPTKAYRIPLDPEVSALARKYNLQNELTISSSGSALDIEGDEGRAVFDDPVEPVQE